MARKSLPVAETELPERFTPGKRSAAGFQAKGASWVGFVFKALTHLDPKWSNFKLGGKQGSVPGGCRAGGHCGLCRVSEPAVHDHV